MPDGESDPDIPWPDNFEVCGVPDLEPSCFAQQTRRPATRMMAWPMYEIPDPVEGMELFCSILEDMSAEAMQQWFALPDRFFHIAAGDVDMDASEVDTKGLTIPGAVITRLRRLRVRTQITLHPHSRVKVWNSIRTLAGEEHTR
ncbi:MAG TPA: hypothetical protein VKX25_09930 [Bryobacteraceae bacterium]|nr:hypothetical protein [Bryobacteraceae bacterium]